jgi:predicted DNA-binding transcriptional regulator AlpA
MTPRLFRTPLAASYLALSPATLEKFRTRGNGPRYLKVGRAVLYDLRDLNRWVDARRRASTPVRKRGS